MSVRLLSIGLAATLAACGLSRPPLERSTYLLAPTREAPAPPAAAKPVAVKVRAMRAAPLYARSDFVYRVDGERVVSDFYNGFAEPPESMLTTATATWLRRAGLFASLIEPGVPVDAPYVLDGSIVVLQGDLRDMSRPAAMVAVEFYLLRVSGPSPQLVYDRVLSSRVSLSSGSPQDVAAGYNRALGEILSELERELAALDLK